MPGVTRAFRERTGEVARPARGRSATSFWWEDVKKRAKAVATAPERLSSKELAERATGMLGAGILKPMAVSSVLVGGAKKVAAVSPYWRAQKRYSARGLTPWISSILRAPQRELSRIKSIRPLYDLERGGWGRYYHPPKSAVRMSMEAPVKRRAGTIWHELTHARQFVPEKGRGAGEFVKAFELRDWEAHLRELAKKAGVSPEEFYLKYNPIEIQARRMSETILHHLGTGKQVTPKMYDRLYEAMLDNALRVARRSKEILAF